LPIVSSELEFDRPQADGRRWLRIKHVDHLGEIHHVIRKVAPGTVVADEITAQRTAVVDGLAVGEQDDLLEGGPANDNLQTVPLKHADRIEMLRYVIRRGFHEYMADETTINRRYRLAKFLGSLPAAMVATQLDVPQAKVASLQDSMSRLLALGPNLAEFVGEIKP
jgi:hypothetical protein